MTKKPFNERNTEGKFGESFVCKYFPQLVHSGIIVEVQDIGSLKFEGADILSYELIPLPEPQVPVMKMLGKDITEASEFSPDSAATPLDFHTSIVEVKRINNFTSRDNDGRLPCGTIPFELWNSPNKDLRPGSLFRMMNPAAYEKSCKPTALIYMLFETGADTVPYACIAFEDFGALEAQLRKLSAIDLDSWVSLPFDRPRRSKYYKGMQLYQNIWYVPFNLISHLATVTMIRTGTLRSIENRCPKEVQRNRLNYLSKLATSATSRVRIRFGTIGALRRLACSVIHQSSTLPRHCIITLTCSLSHPQQLQTSYSPGTKTSSIPIHTKKSWIASCSWT